MAELASVLETPWNMSTSADLAFPATRGERPEKFEEARQFEGALSAPQSPTRSSTAPRWKSPNCCSLRVFCANRTSCDGSRRNPLRQPPERLGDDGLQPDAASRSTTVSDNLPF